MADAAAQGHDEEEEGEDDVHLLLLLLREHRGPMEHIYVSICCYNNWQGPVERNVEDIVDGLKETQIIILEDISEEKRIL